MSSNLPRMPAERRSARLIAIFSNGDEPKVRLVKSAPLSLRVAK